MNGPTSRGNGARQDRPEGSSGSVSLRDPAAVNADVAGRLRKALAFTTYRKVSAATGYNHETVRRYLLGGAAVPAGFVANACRAYGLSADWVLFGGGPRQSREVLAASVRRADTEMIMKEVGRRLDALALGWDPEAPRWSTAPASRFSLSDLTADLPTGQDPLRDGVGVLIEGASTLLTSDEALAPARWQAAGPERASDSPSGAVRDRAE